MESHRIMKEWQNLLGVIEAEVAICYILGHSDLTWNEEADRLAGLAVPLGMLQFTPSDIYSDGGQTQGDSDGEVQDQCWLVTRLKERGYKYGGGGSVSVLDLVTNPPTALCGYFITCSTLYAERNNLFSSHKHTSHSVVISITCSNMHAEPN